MEMGAAAILDGEVAGVVEIRANEPVLGKTHAVARVGLGDVARRRVGEMHPVGVADVVEERFPVAVRIRILLPALFIADDGQVRPEGAEARRFPGAVLAEGHVGVVALGRDFGHEAAQALALRCQILILHELGMLGHEIRGDLAVAEVRILDDLTEEGNGRVHAADDILAEGALHDAQGLLPVMGIGDEQGAGGVIVGREVVARGNIGVEAHAGAAGGHVAGNQARVGSEIILRVLQVDAHLHGRVAGLESILVVAELGAEGHGDLLFHEINAVAAFRDAVLHLQTGVHLDHVGIAVRGHEKFHRGQGLIAHGAHEPAGVFLEPGAQFRGHAFPGGRRDFHELLVVALHGAVTFVKGEDIAVMVGQHLDLDVMHISQELLHEETRVAEGRLGHGGGFEEGVLELGLAVHGEDAAATAAAFGLEHDGQPDLIGELARLINGHGSLGAGNDRDAQLAGHLAALDLVAEQVHGLLGGADEDNAVVPAEGREAAVFRSEAPAGMDAHHAAALGKLHDALDIKIGTRVRAQKKQFLRGRGGRCRFVNIGSRHGCDGVKALPDGTADAAGRNTAVGNQYDLAL